MKANHNIVWVAHFLSLVVVNISKSKNESKSQLSNEPINGIHSCGKYQ